MFSGVKPMKYKPMQGSAIELDSLTRYLTLVGCEPEIRKAIFRNAIEDINKVEVIVRRGLCARLEGLNELEKKIVRGIVR